MNDEIVMLDKMIEEREKEIYNRGIEVDKRFVFVFWNLYIYLYIMKLYIKLFIFNIFL